MIDFINILTNIIPSQHNVWSMWFMIYDLSQRPRTVSLGSLVVERTSGTQHTAYRPTIGGYSTYHYQLWWYVFQLWWHNLNEDTIGIYSTEWGDNWNRKWGYIYGAMNSESTFDYKAKGVPAIWSLMNIDDTLLVW